MAKTRGFKALEKKLTRIPEKAALAVDSATYDALEPVFVVSQELVPVDTGALRESGELSHLDNDLGARIKYGGATQGGEPGPSVVDYAMPIHERGDKYLEIPFTAQQAEMKEIIKAQTKKQLKRARGSRREAKKGQVRG